MKRTKTASNYGIMYTGKHLHQFNKRFLDICENSDNAHHGIIALFTVVFAGFTAWFAWEKCVGTVPRLVMTTLPLMVVAIVLALCIVPKDYALRQIQYAMILSLVPLFAITGACAGNADLLSYGLYVLIFSGSAFGGMRMWSRFAVKRVWSESKNVSEDAKMDFSLGIAVGLTASAAVTPFVKAIKSASVKAIVMTVVIVAMSVLLGFVAGTAWGNARYYRFLKRKK